MALSRKLAKTCLIIILATGSMTIVSYLAYAGFMYFALSNFEIFPGVGSTTPSEYLNILQGLGKSWQPYISHFPDTIPPHARQVRFYYSEPNPRFGGPYILSLSMRLPEEEVETIRSQIERQAIHQYVLDQKNIHNSGDGKSNHEPSKQQYSFYIGSQIVSGELLNQYSLYILGDNRDMLDEQTLYRTQHGVAINELTSDVIFWMQNRHP